MSNDAGKLVQTPTQKAGLGRFEMHSWNQRFGQESATISNMKMG